MVFGISGYFRKYLQFQLFKLRLCLFVERPTDRLYIFNTVLGGLAWSAVFGTKNCAIYDGGRQLNFDQFDFPASFRPAKGAGETVKPLSRARKRGYVKTAHGRFVQSEAYCSEAWLRLVFLTRWGRGALAEPGV